MLGLFSFEYRLYLIDFCLLLPFLFPSCKCNRTIRAKNKQAFSYQIFILAGKLCLEFSSLGSNKD